MREVDDFEKKLETLISTYPTILRCEIATCLQRYANNILKERRAWIEQLEKTP